MKDLLSMGPPVYWVVKSKNLNYSSEKVLKKLCGGQGCDSDSLSMQLYFASQYTNQ